MTELKFNDLAKHAAKGLGPLRRIGLAIMFLLAPGFVFVVLLKTFFKLTEDLSDDAIKEMMEAIKNA